MSQSLRKHYQHNPNVSKGRIVSDETRAKIEEASRRMWASEGFIHPFARIGGCTVATREKMSRARKGKRFGRISAQDILSACLGCVTQKQVAEKLNCTAANISLLIKSFNIGAEIKTILGPNRRDRKEV